MSGNETSWLCNAKNSFEENGIGRWEVGGMAFCRLLNRCDLLDFLKSTLDEVVAGVVVVAAGIAVMVMIQGKRE
ncbi:hypothetical protein F6V25_16825 [Oryzomonas japonica]|uniref:Uncharacterized protein n=1 Tax=Oryzomonas japonica TaxID=2603858 RepID=A0A7J4ZLM5_9BACT|nr:hypothetical protein [Oryzomonas japonica]KAB0663446.1 hypothetical protein F6V25_16825 [Oryzomonas japonica]